MRVKSLFLFSLFFFFLLFNLFGVCAKCLRMSRRTLKYEKRIEETNEKEVVVGGRGY